MAQLGSGLDTSYPNAIDTYQVYRNGTPMAPDSDTRVDAEYLNDVLRAMISVQTTLGTNPQGIYGSVAARLNQFLPGGTTLLNLIPFTSQTSIFVSGSQHQLSTADLFWAVWSADNPRVPIDPDSFLVHPTTFDVLVQFSGSQSGVLVLANPQPAYGVTFVNETVLTIPAGIHGLGTNPLLYQVYDAQVPASAIEPGLLTVDMATGEVVCSFAGPQSGRLLLSPGEPFHRTVFTSQLNISVPGTTHGLGTNPLLYQVYDASTPAVAIPPGLLQMSSTTGDVLLGFAGAQSGRLLLSGYGTATPVTTLSLPSSTTVRTSNGATQALWPILESILARLEALERIQATALSSPTPEEDAV